jgi:hypothetical protein
LFSEGFGVVGVFEVVDSWRFSGIVGCC